MVEMWILEQIERIMKRGFFRKSDKKDLLEIFHEIRIILQERIKEKTSKTPVGEKRKKTR